MAEVESALTRPEGISVIICCYNSENRITPTLEHLFLQKIEFELRWEIIVVDNNCTDNTNELATSLLTSTSHVPFKIVSQPIPGLMNAREMGIEYATFNFLLFVDDDNSLCNNYVGSIFTALSTNPSYGMIGGKGIPVIEGKTPDWFPELSYCFAVGDQGVPDNQNIIETELLYGAGMALRYEAIAKIKNAGFQSMLVGRKGASLSSGEDNEIAWALKMAGYKIGYISSLTFNHHLPQGRLNWAYMKKLFYHFGQAKPRLDLYRDAIELKPRLKNNRLPYWIDRAIFLIKQAFPDLFLVVRSHFSDTEGNIKILFAFGRMGEIMDLLKMRGEYLRFSAIVHDFRQRLHENEK
ncbi:MAG: glycosyltransferase [Flavobacteriales bacterium]|nr:glycosyltransferase [Flavobacteriales bacterium]